MPTYLTPGVYIEEVSGGARPIEAVGTSTPAFLGVAPNPTARVNEPVAVNSWSQFAREFVRDDDHGTTLANAVLGFFNNGGARCWVVNVGEGGSIAGGGTEKRGVDLLESIDEITMVAAPGYADAMAYETILGHCEKMRDRIAILDAPADVANVEALTKVATAGGSGEGDTGPLGLRPRESADGFGTFYFPYITVRDALDPQKLVNVPPSGHMAGIYARTDATRGVHKAPANEPVRGAVNVAYRVTHQEQGVLNPAGVNVIRSFSREGILVWGARTVGPSSSEYRYLNVRRLMIMIEQSIRRSANWLVFEPNDPTLWKAIRRDVSAFLTLVWRSGALFGETPEQSFFVKCDAETNPPEVIDAGQLVIMIGVAPVKPAEFVIFRIGLTAGGDGNA